MEFSLSELLPLLALLISISAIANAYLLRGGKLAWSQILIALAMISFLLSMVLGRFLPQSPLIGDGTLLDILFALGFVLLLIASLKLHASLK